MYDIVFISYDEPNYKDNLKRLKKQLPARSNLIHIHNVQGISNAHKAAASSTTTSHIFVVDGDCHVMDDFEFTYHNPLQNHVYVWRSLNPVNNLIYGYGAIKLVPKDNYLHVKDTQIDITSHLSLDYVIIDKISNITNFNSDPLHAWRGAFRECAKLASSIIPNHNTDETINRLNVWCSKGIDMPYGPIVLQAANEGRKFGIQYRNDKNKLASLNDYSILSQMFYERYPECQ